MKNIIIMASGNGSNYQYISDTIENLKLDINIIAVVCNDFKAGVIKKAKINKHKLIVKETNGRKRDIYDLELVSDIINLNQKIDLIVLAGWMRILTNSFISVFKNIINLHPALPRTYPGTSW